MSGGTVDPEKNVEKARAELATLKATADQCNARIEEIRDHPDYSETYRREKVAALQEERFQAVQATSTRVTELLDQAHTQADEVLRTTQAGASGAYSRVQAALEQLGPAAAAELLAESHDAEGLRALRAALPLHVATLLKNDARSDRQALTRELQESIERRLEGLTDGAEASAIRARRAGADEREHLKRLSEHVLHPQSPSRMMAYGYAVSAQGR